ncbi:PRC-barrel domain containing protein [Sphingomonas sp. IC4-52]|uniref:PRC-barrel domain containing protein n=1 Tax=Sphingomonas sp. IC4-52 TaxID=2887202 RepID=UPI001D12B31A|nr:PRC-barrel domain containing protein [Sphingomonas sp. IC4-52]MCC2981073.1 PRC-barrel domain containing protein [Sphingomonas sp. IC4-52]
MTKAPITKGLVALFGSAALLTACNSAQERAEDQREDAAEASAAASGSAIAALGLTEAQLLDADIIDASNRELGEVEGVVRGSGGQVEHLLVELEGSNPARTVQVPVAGLKPVKQGTDTDLSTTMTAEQLTALPDAAPAQR